MSWIRIYIHLVFSTKNRYPYLDSPTKRTNVNQHVLRNAKNKNINLIAVNGYHEHLHCLISLNKEQSISDVAKLIKGESSHWINQNKIVQGRFNWQDDYWAVGVSESHMAGVRNYIYNQEEHHKKVSFNEEIGEFMEKYGWVRIKD